MVGALVQLSEIQESPVKYRTVNQIEYIAAEYLVKYSTVVYFVKCNTVELDAVKPGRVVTIEYNALSNF